MSGMPLKTKHCRGKTFLNEESAVGRSGATPPKLMQNEPSEETELVGGRCLTCDLYQSGGQIGLARVKAHADHQAILATIQGMEMHLPTPYSCLKYRISKNLIREWGEFRDGPQSESGHRIRSVVAGIDKKFVITNNFLIYFLIKHGPFPCYLQKFKKLGSPLCACGLVGDVDHYVFRCPLTAEFHLKEPSDEHRKSWFKNLRYNGHAQSKLIQAYKISNGICDRLTQG
ncbi:hypothetical protein AVEN_32464-1 [Araneus ventricosus]|uniref:Uncharacterized protein n=1 Tax=Araneus ventricosus TaxID=182803 RepID=A0A4Y2EQG0_ARAVE|nr:hypothetical protein AVEN_32464-1 [Araneus ventricosus]